MPLSDLLVLDFAGVLAGPSVGMFLAELGARVVKVENHTAGGDVTRSWRLSEELDTNTVSAYFRSLTWGKESISSIRMAGESRRTLYPEQMSCSSTSRQAPRTRVDYDRMGPKLMLDTQTTRRTTNGTR